MVTATGPDPRTKPNCDGEGGAEGIGGLGCVGHSFPLDFRRPHMAFQNQKSERGKSLRGQINGRMDHHGKVKYPSGVEGAAVCEEVLKSLGMRSDQGVNRYQ